MEPKEVAEMVCRKATEFILDVIQERGLEFSFCGDPFTMAKRDVYQSRSFLMDGDSFKCSSCGGNVGMSSILDDVVEILDMIQEERGTSSLEFVRIYANDSEGVASECLSVSFGVDLKTLLIKFTLECALKSV